jgi:hypothetical protein
LKITVTIPLFVIVVAASVIPVAAHHSVSQMFDTSKEITIQGMITKIEWTNPHARLWVDAKNENGAVSNWELQLPAPNAIRYENVNRDFVKAGDQVTVVLWRAKNGSAVAHALTVTVPGGHAYSFPREWGVPASPK